MVSNEVQNLVLFMESHAYTDVKRALKILALQNAALAVEERKADDAALIAGGWKRWDPERDLPDNHEYRSLRNAVYVREIEGVAARGIRLRSSEIKAVIASYGPERVKLKSQLRDAMDRIRAAANPGTMEAPANGRKTDVSMQPTDRKCPICGEVMAWEPICAGCALGRMGFRGRYVCMDDFDHTFYVTKPGVELPNR